MKVYHFLKTEYALLALRNRRLKISRLNELNDPFELVAATRTNKEQRPIWDAWRQKQIETWGIVCFSKTWRNSVLWSHYADRHRGMCLGFEVPNDVLIRMKYTKNRLDLDIEKLYAEGKLRKEHMQLIFKTKFSDWKYEREVRVVARLEKMDEQTGHYFHSFDDQITLTDVIAGPLFNGSEALIQESLQPADRGAKVFKARLAFQTFDVVQQLQGF